MTRTHKAPNIYTSTCINISLVWPYNSLCPLVKGACARNKATKATILSEPWSATRALTHLKAMEPRNLHFGTKTWEPRQKKWSRNMRKLFLMLSRVLISRPKRIEANLRICIYMGGICCTYDLACLVPGNFQSLIMFPSRRVRK